MAAAAGAVGRRARGRGGGWSVWVRSGVGGGVGGGGVVVGREGLHARPYHAVARGRLHARRGGEGGKAGGRAGGQGEARYLIYRHCYDSLPAVPPSLTSQCFIQFFVRRPSSKPSTILRPGSARPESGSDLCSKFSTLLLPSPAHAFNKTPVR